jgi:ribosome-binding ATPase
VSLEVGIVGLPGSGKTTLFNALTRAHAAHDFGKEHLGVAPIADERLEPVARIAGSGKVTPAVVRVLDAPGTGPAHLNNLRRAHALLAVLDAFSPGADPSRDLETLELELLVADRDHVERRLERVRSQAKSGDPSLKREVSELEALLAELEAGRPVRELSGKLLPELEPLTAKPLLVVENGPAGVDAKFEEELADLDDEEADAFREGPSALNGVLPRLFEELRLITFFTANENEAHAWTLTDGQSALDAAGVVHSDMARGFIRCEVIPWRDLVETGSHAEASRRGLMRLEGKTYVVQDGDVLYVRFNV